MIKNDSNATAKKQERARSRSEGGGHEGQSVEGKPDKVQEAG
jgi:hypothetical protein